MEFEGVRLANSSDRERLFDFLINLYKENALFSMSDAKVREHIALSTDPKTGFCGIIEGDYGIEASIGTVLRQPWYSDDWLFDELWNFVHPDNRKTTHAKRLVEFAKFMSIRLQAPLLMSVVTRKRLEAKMRLFQRQLPQIGAWFVWGKEFEDSFNQRKI